VKPFTREELLRIAQRCDRQRINQGFEMPQPLLADRSYICGGEYVRPEEMVHRLAVALAAMRVAVGLDEVGELE